MCDTKNLTVLIPKIKNLISMTTLSDGRLILTGIEGKYLQLLLNYLDVNVKFTSYHDSVEFNSPIELVDAGVADMATTVIMSHERFKTAGLSNPYNFDHLTFVVRKYVPISTRFAFLYPSTLDTWLGLIVVFIFLPVLGHKILKIRLLSYSDLLFHICGSVFKQPLNVPIESLQSKLFLFFWLFFTMAITSIYSATVFSFMVNHLKNPSVRNYEELTNAVIDGTHKWHILYLSKAILNSFNQSENSKVQELLKEMKDKNYFSHSGANLDFYKTLANGNSLHYLDVILRLMFDTNPSLYISDENISLIMISFYFRKNFCLKNKINTFISRASSAGLLQKCFREVQMEESIAWMKNSDFVSSTVKPLSLHDISGVIILLFSGYILSLIVLILEIIMDKFMKTINVKHEK